MTMYVKSLIVCVLYCTIQCLTALDENTRHINNLNFKNRSPGFNLVEGKGKDDDNSKCKDSDECDDDGSSFWKIFGIIAGVLVLALVFLVVGLCIFCRRNGKRGNKLYWTRRSELRAEENSIPIDILTPGNSGGRTNASASSADGKTEGMGNTTSSFQNANMTQDPSSSYRQQEYPPAPLPTAHISPGIALFYPSMDEVHLEPPPPYFPDNTGEQATTVGGELPAKININSK